MGISVLLKSDMLEYFLPYIPMSKFYRFFIIPVDDDLNRFESSLYNDVFKHLKMCPEYWFLKILIVFCQYYQVKIRPLYCGLNLPQRIIN